MGLLVKTVAVVEARRQFSELLASVEAGEEVIITRRGRTVARLVPEPGRSAAGIFGDLWDEDFGNLEAPQDAHPEPVPSVE